jgi:hypothetical protein
MSGIVGRGSGSVYFPGSKEPFRPLNPHGRAMPKPARPYRPERHALHQVEIELRGGGTKRIGPMWAEEMAGSLAATINKTLVLKPMDDWVKARVVLAKPAEKRDTRTIGELLLKGV